MDILEQDDEKEAVLLDDAAKKSICELEKWLLKVVKDLQKVEQNHDDEQMLSMLKFYCKVRHFVDSSNVILDSAFSNDYLSTDIDNLVKNIRNLTYPFPTQSIWILNAGGNTNQSGGYQNVGPFNVNCCPGETSHERKRDQSASFSRSLDLHFVGFKHEIETLLNHVLQPTHDGINFVGIVGMGGSGKTTLARQIYHHPKIEEHFKCKAWVWISRSWDTPCILREIWRQVKGEIMAVDTGLEHVLEKLHDFLTSQTYFLILDYVWSKDVWNHIDQAFPWNRGSTILVTTRDKFLPQLIDCNARSVEPKKLNEVDSYELFKKKASTDILHRSQSLTKNMMKNCEGFPLAIISLPSFLRINNACNWQSKIDELSHHMLEFGELKDTLKQSFHKLPFHYMSCVLYLRVFPQNHVIEAQKLIQMLIVEHFLDNESEGEEYLEKMVRQSIVEVVETNHMGQVHQFRISGFIYQMLVHFNKKRGLFEDTLRLAPSKTLNLHPRHISHHRSAIFRDYDKPILDPLFKNFKSLIVVVLHNIFETKIPKEIENLIHLRYLELGGNLELPTSIGNLKNLTTLDLTHVSCTKIELYLCKLKKLKHLSLPLDPKVIIDMEKLNLEELKELKTLRNARGGEWMLSGMSKLSHVLKDICISGIGSKEQLEAVLGTPSIASKNLHTLELGWCNGSVELRDLSVLRECDCLKELTLSGKIGESTPIEFPPNLLKLELISSSICERDVMNKISNSCPELNTLVLRKQAYIGCELECNANSLIFLEKLTLEDLGDIKMWIIAESAMPYLQHLTIKGCRDLNLNGEGWRHISKIIPVECTDLCCEFKKKLQKYRKDVDGMDLSPESREKLPVYSKCRTPLPAALFPPIPRILRHFPLFTLILRIH